MIKIADVDGLMCRFCVSGIKKYSCDYLTCEVKYISVHRLNETTLVALAGFVRE